MPKLIFERWIDAGPPSGNHTMRAFLSATPVEYGFAGLVRDFDPRNERDSVLWLIFFRGLFQGVYEGWHRCHGEDPRVFNFRGEPYAIFVRSDPDARDWRIILLPLCPPRLISPVELRIDSAAPIYHGKNWVPVPDGDRLFIIRSLDPLVVLQADTRTGVCDILSPNKTWGREIGQHRGGSNATYRDGIITGFGHRTRRSEHHTLFSYSIDTANWQVQFEDIETPPELGEFGIIDPTSQFGDRLIVVATPSHWMTAQPVRHALLKIAPPI